MMPAMKSLSRLNTCWATSSDFFQHAQWYLVCSPSGGVCLLTSGISSEWLATGTRSSAWRAQSALHSSRGAVPAWAAAWASLSRVQQHMSKAARHVGACGCSTLWSVRLRMRAVTATAVQRATLPCSLPSRASSCISQAAASSQHKAPQNFACHSLAYNFLSILLSNQ